VEDSKDARPLSRFIVGMSRGGTTWMALSLNEHPRVAVFGESEFWGRLFVEPDASGQYTATEVERVRELLAENPLNSTIEISEPARPGWMQHVYRADVAKIVCTAIDALDVPVSPGTLFNVVGSALARADQKEIWIEKTPRHVNWTDRILRYLPRSRFVVMIREPYSFLLSYKHQGDRKPEESRTRFDRRYHPLGVALIWRANMRAALRLARARPSDALMVDLREVREQPEAVMERVQRFFELEPSPLSGVRARENSSFSSESRPKLQPAEILWVNLVAGREMREAGFERRHAPFDPLGFLWSLLRVPAWAVRAVLDVFERTESGALNYIWRWLRPV